MSPAHPSPGSASGPSTPATQALELAGLAYVRHTYRHDPAARSFGLEAAQALGLDAARVFKTLLVDRGGPSPASKSGGERLAVAIVPVSGRLDLKAAAAALGCKAVVMARPVAAERSTGYVVGGISPIGQKRSLPTLLDASACTFTTVFVSGGRRGFDLELTPSDLLAVTGGSSAVIARP